MATVYEEAVKHPDWCPIQPQDCWTELPDADWNPLQRALIDAMPGERVQPRALDALRRVSPAPSGVSRGRSASTPDAADEPAGVLDDAGIGSRHSLPKPTIALFHAGGREAEIEEVFRRILATGASLDQVEIACASDAHVALVWEKALRHDWPVTLGPGIPAALTRPGRALIGLCDWIETDFSAGHFRRLLQSGDLGVERRRRRLHRGPGRAPARAGGSRAGDARHTASRSDGCTRATSRAPRIRTRRTRIARDAQREGRLGRRAFATGLRPWSKSVPEPGADGKVPLQAVVSAVLDFLEHTTARSSALDHRAAAALQDHIGELRALGAFSCRLCRRRCASSASACSRSTWRPSVRAPVISTPARSRRRATPAALTSSSSASKKGGCSRRRRRTPCCSTPSAPRFRPACGCRPTGSTKPCTPC